MTQPSDVLSSRQRLGNLVACLAGLALCLWHVMDGWVREPSTALHDYRLEVVTDAKRIPAAARGQQVWLSDLTIDGSAARDARVERRGSWKTESANSGWKYVCENPLEPTSLSFRAATCSFNVVKHPWSGCLDVYRDGVRVATLELTSVESSAAAAVFGLHRCWGRVLSVLAAIVVALALVKPWRGGPRLTGWLALLVAVLHFEVWSSFPIGLTNDSPGYIEAIDSLRAGAPDYFPPGYGLLIVPCGWFAHPGLAVTFVQHASMVVLAVALQLRFRQWCGEAWSFVGALLGAIAFPTLFGAKAVMSETLACVQLAGPILLAMHGDERAGHARALGAGILTGWACLTRVVPLLVLLPLLVVRGLLPWPRRSWRWVLLSVGSAIALVALFVANTGLRSGQWNLSAGTGRHLYNHFVYEEKLLDPDGPKTRELVQRTGAKDLRDLPHWHVHGEPADAGAIEPLFLSVALEAARTVSVWELAAFTAVLTWRNLATDAAPTMTVGDSTSNGCPRLAHDALRRDSGSVLVGHSRAWNATTWSILCWLFVASAGVTFLLRSGRAEWLAWISMVWGYMFASSAVEHELPRYHVAVAPMVAMLGVATIGVLLQSFRRKIAGASRQGAERPAATASA